MGIFLPTCRARACFSLNGSLEWHWASKVFNRTQENLLRGGLHGRSANGRRQTTRPVHGIDQDLRLNRALWLLADGLRQLKA